MRSTVLRPLGIVTAAAVMVLFAHGADAKSKKKKKQPASTAPAACTQLKEKACRARSDCIYTAVVTNEKVKTVRTKASCKALAKEPVKKAEPTKEPAKK